MTVGVTTDTLTLDSVKEHLQIDFDTDDTLLHTFIEVSAEMVQAKLSSAVLLTSYSTDIPPLEGDYAYTATKPNYLTLTYTFPVPAGTYKQVSNKYNSAFAVAGGICSATQELNASELSEFMEWGAAESSVYFAEEGNVKIDLHEMLIKCMELFDVAYSPSDITAIQAEFQDKPKGTALIEHCRKLLIGDMYENRSESTYYRNMKWSSNAEAILNTLKSSQW